MRGFSQSLRSEETGPLSLDHNRWNMKLEHEAGETMLMHQIDEGVGDEAIGPDALGQREQELPLHLRG